ncbi:nucleolin-like isoform X2 [Platichthys flesus]|uniref:nucleolin-like isoform X2 n=1 Tax=Platichthys flesus TaxID=8260 RepID=UPI002DBA22A8|nr:nucleolin-like isoform X2 [Platichthys flesus]
MAKTDTPRRKTRQSKVVTDEVGEMPNTEEQTTTVCSSGLTVVTEEKAATGSTETKQEEKNQDDQESPMDCVIEVKGNTPTVAVSWEKTNEGEGGDSEKRSESQMDTAAEGNGSTTTVTGTEKPEEEINGNEQMVVGEKAVKSRKRKSKAQANVETSPAKKTKVTNDGFCLYVGNLNNSKTFEEVKDSLAKYFMTKSLLFQDIRLDRSKKHAHVDLASEMDLTKALTLNGQIILEKPVKIAKAKVKSADEVKAPVDKKAARDARCLFVKNLPFTATKADIQKIFEKAVNVRFPDGAEGPSKGIAFVEFKNPGIAKEVQKKMQGAKIEERVLIVDSVKETNGTKDGKASDAKSITKAAAPPNNTLFVSNMSFDLKEKTLRKYFQKAIDIKMPLSKGKSKGYAFVEFATVAQAAKALKSTQNINVFKRTMKVQFFEMRPDPAKAKVTLKTLIIGNLSEKTTAETLKSAFEGALTARVAVDKETGASKQFGFVEFESKESCKAAKEAMLDCEIDGSKVTVAYANPQGAKGEQGTKGGVKGPPGGQPAGPSRGVDLKTLIIKNLSVETTAETLKNAVKGAVTARVTVNKETGVSKRFGFAEFESEESCKAAKEAMQGCEIDGSKVTVAYAKPKGEQTPKAVLAGTPVVKPPRRGRDRIVSTEVDLKTLVIKNLSETTTAETLKSAVKEALTARVILDKDTGASKRFGFVEFESEENCKAVKEAMQDCEIDGSKVTLAYAKPKGEHSNKGGVAGNRGARRRRSKTPQATVEQVANKG